MKELSVQEGEKGKCCSENEDRKKKNLWLPATYFLPPYLASACVSFGNKFIYSLHVETAWFSFSHIAIFTFFTDFLFLPVIYSCLFGACSVGLVMVVVGGRGVIWRGLTIWTQERLQVFILSLCLTSNLLFLHCRLCSACEWQHRGPLYCRCVHTEAPKIPAKTPLEH